MNIFETTMENETFAPREQTLHFPLYLETTMENETFAPKEQTLHFPLYLQKRISKASKGIIIK